MNPPACIIVDDRVLHWSIERDIALPVILTGVYDHTAHRRRKVVRAAAGGCAVPERVVVPARVRIDQDLAGIEPQAARGQVARAIRPIRVVDSGLYALHIHVPEAEGAMVAWLQADDLVGLHSVVPAEQQQVDRRRALGEHTEVDAVVVQGGAHWMGPSRSEGIGRCTH